MFDLPALDMRVLVVRDADVPTYVEHGAADLRIQRARRARGAQQRPLRQPLDLGIGKCRLSVAEPDRSARARAVDDEGRGAHLRYCTKFPNLTRRHLEVRPASSPTSSSSTARSSWARLTPGLSDRIVDLVSSRRNRKAQHRLREIEVILDGHVAPGGQPLPPGS